VKPSRGSVTAVAVCRSGPARQHLRGLGARRELRVVAADLGAAERRAQIGRAGTGGPQPGQRSRDTVELPGVGPLKSAATSGSSRAPW